MERAGNRKWSLTGFAFLAENSPSSRVGFYKSYSPSTWYRFSLYLRMLLSNPSNGCSHLDSNSLQRQHLGKCMLSIKKVLKNINTQ